MSKQRKSRRNCRKSNELHYLETALYNNGAAKLEGPRNKTWSKHDLKTISPLTNNQEEMFHAWYNFDHVCAYGTAGTGKTFLAMYLALRDVVLNEAIQEKIIIVRSVVPTREVGFLPGDLAEKVSVYELPYRDICAELIGRNSTYDDMKEAGLIQFMPTSFIRGLTWNNTIVLVEEGQNMSFHEINSIMTRVGHNTRVIFTGDTAQSDLKPSESGMSSFLEIIDDMSGVGKICFNRHDIVRDDFVKSWIIASENYAAA